MTENPIAAYWIESVGVSCTPYQRLGYGTQIRHELLLKSN